MRKKVHETMKFTAKVQEKKKGGKREPNTKQKYIFLPAKAEFEKGEFVDVNIKKK